MIKLGSTLNDKHVIYPESYAPVPALYTNGKINDWADRAHNTSG